MKSALRVQRKADELRIRICGLPGSGTAARAESALVVAGGGMAICTIGIARGPDEMGIFLFALCATLCFGYLFVRAIDQLSLRERVIINKQELLLGRWQLSKSRWRRYRLAGISGFTYLPIKDEEHPSPAPTGDHLEKGCGAVFRYNDEYVQFGLGLHSWEVEELENLIADFTGYDLRYEGQGEYGAEPEPTLRKPLPVAGQWVGTFVRTDDAGLAVEEALSFRLFIDEVDASGFRGRWLELDGPYAHLDPADLQGYVDDERIEFTKQFDYTVADGLDGYRAVHAGRLAPLQYFEGTYNESTRLLSGGWRQDGADGEASVMGEWEARKDD